MDLWDTLLNIPNEQCATDFAEYFAPVAKKAYETTWGLTDHDKRLCGLLKGYAHAVKALTDTNELAQDELGAVQDERNALQAERDVMMDIIAGLRQAKDEGAEIVRTQRAENGELRRRIADLEKDLDQVVNGELEAHLRAEVEAEVAARAEAEKQVTSLRMQLGKAKKKIEKLESK